MMNKVTVARVIAILIFLAIEIAIWIAVYPRRGFVVSTITFVASIYPVMLVCALIGEHLLRKMKSRETKL